MTKSIPSFACSAMMLVSGVASTAQAQAPQQQYAPPVAILDLPYLLRNHTRFKQSDEVLKAEIGQAEASVQQERKKMEELAVKLREYKPGSPDYKQIEEQLAKMEADLALQVNLMKRNFGEKRAKSYFDVYTEISNYTRYHAEQAGILLVLNFNGDPIDAGNPQSIIAQLNSVVLYKHRAIDITPIILDMCERGVQIPQPAVDPAAQRPTTLPR